MLIIFIHTWERYPLCTTLKEKQNKKSEMFTTDEIDSIVVVGTSINRNVKKSYRERIVDKLRHIKVFWS